VIPLFLNVFDFSKNLFQNLVRRGVRGCCCLPSLVHHVEFWLLVAGRRLGPAFRRARGPPVLADGGLGGGGGERDPEGEEGKRRTGRRR
jgi:hypothetical protein